MSLTPILNRFTVIVLGGNLNIGDLSAWRVFHGIDDCDFIAHLFCGDSHHFSELSASDNADDGAGINRFYQTS